MRKKSFSTLDGFLGIVMQRMSTKGRRQKPFFLNRLVYMITIETNPGNVTLRMSKECNPSIHGTEVSSFPLFLKTTQVETSRIRCYR
mmetsp:Transcript_15588/g.32256  ORF Transcript_15588/g.32256 Transcript_15588/m.32256 type:complete len:87 (+) Transcript_15588:595-855(+)